MGTDNLLELQDNGYKSTVSAISEIIDNSIQANASNIEIIIIRNTTRSADEIEEILVIDDGDGMDEKTFDKALQMSSGNRSKAKSGLGKYGQGLPNSSISQTKRVEVYTWQEKRILFNYIDLEEIYKSKEPFLPEIERKKHIDIPLIKSGKYKIEADSGTIVRWVQPNKVKPKTAKTLVSHIEQIAGRTFRYFLNGFKDTDGKKYKCRIKILVFDFNGKNYEPNDFTSKLLEPFDPMFLMPKTQMNGLFPESKHPTNELYKESIKKTFNVYYNNEIVKSTVEIRLSYCRKEERERYGRNAGGTSFGKKYLYRNMVGTSGYNNISIIRAGREIDSGSFGFIGDISDNRERWWSAEIIIEPIIDSIVGIDNKKQQASQIHFLDTSELSDSDNHEINKWISTYLYENIKQVKNIIDAQNASSRSGGKKDEPKLPPGSDTEPGDPADLEKNISDSEKKKVRKEFYEWIKERYPELKDKEIWEIVDYSLSLRDNHIFIKSDLGDSQLFSYNVFGTKVLIEINYSHSFYKRFISHFEEYPSQEKSLRSIRLLIGAMVNAEIVNKTSEKALVKDRRNIKNRMAESLDDYIEDLYSE
jgi:hypothetical protein